MTELLTDFCTIPTAPFREGRVLAFIDRFAAGRPAITRAVDGAGNRLLTVGGPGRRSRAKSKGRRLVFVAHTDHPGFVASADADGRHLAARFRGAVRAEFVNGARVRFFPEPADFDDIDSDDRAGVPGKVTAVSVDERGRPADVVVKLVKGAAPVPAGSPGMFDLPAGRIKGKKRPRFVGRCCDDLGGVAACLAMLGDLAQEPPPHEVGVLLTRAEEDGFVGALAAVHDRSARRLLRDDDLLVSVETSQAQPAAPIGGGVTVRVGDASSVFDSALTAFLVAQARALADEGGDFKYQRALMPGGTCEATVFHAWGFTSAAACVPLGNYHNMDTDKGKVGPESIDVGDWRNMVALFVRCARHAGSYAEASDGLKSRLAERFEAQRGLL